MPPLTSFVSRVVHVCVCMAVFVRVCVHVCMAVWLCVRGCGAQLYVSCLARRSGVHAGHVTAVAVAPARQPLPYAATGGEDQMVRLWYRPIHTVSGDSLTAAEAVAKEKQADKKRMLLRGHNAPITAVHLDTFKIVSTSYVAKGWCWCV